MDQDNRRRALSEVVSLDAWHEAFSKKRGESPLHVDVAFTEGRIGEEAASNVRFRLRLKRAEVVVIVHATEPAKVIKSTVHRDTRHSKAHITETHTSKDSTEIGAGAKLGVSPAALIPTANIHASISESVGFEKAVKITEHCDLMQVTQRVTPSGDYAWVIEPVIGNFLSGRPWDASKDPRLTVKDVREDRTKGIEPSIGIELRCRREDLEITDITLKNNESLMQQLKDPRQRNKMLAAEALIRTRLAESGLLHGDIADPFARITLSAIISEGE